MKGKHLILLEPNPPEGGGGGGEPIPAWQQALADTPQPQPTPPEPPEGTPATPPEGTPPASGSGQPAAPPEGTPSTPPEGTPPEGVPAQPPPVTLDPETLKSIMSEAVRSVAQPPQQQQQMSAAEYAKAFNVFTPTTEDLSLLGIEATPERVQHFSNMLQSAVRQAVTMAAVQHAVEMKAVREQFQPLQAHYQQQQEANLKVEFFKQYPDLKGTDALLEKINASLKQAGTQFKTKEEAFKTVAETARTIINQVRQGQPPQGQPPQGGGSQNNSPTPPNPMPTLSNGGQGGAGAAPGGSDNRPIWQKALS